MPNRRHKLAFPQEHVFIREWNDVVAVTQSKRNVSVSVRLDYANLIIEVESDGSMPDAADRSPVDHTATIVEAGVS